ncbi:MAG TPA: IPT/TIG domain-containing protein [Candidatus Angelobacter sp.]|nr:IPT/TIG domain-containing protein [Candidatus Angelobacter sp.]
MNLVVQDFNLSAASSSQTVTAGAGATYSLSGLIVNGFTGSVGLTASGLPAGASATFSPTSFTGAGASTLNVATSASTPPGTYTITATGTSGCRTHGLPLTLIVNPPPVTGPNISSLSISAGPVGTAVTITGVNFGATRGTSTVTFNGIAAQSTAWSANSISVSVPRGAKTGNVVVTVGGQVSNSVAFTVQDDAVHIFANNCSTCGWQTTDFTIQSLPLYGYVIQSGDILYFYQWQSVGSVAGIEVCFPSGEGVACADDGRTVDQDGKVVHADTIQGVTHFRRVDLTPNAGQTLSQISFHSHGTTQAGRWDVYFSNVQIVSADGTVRSIFITGSTPGLFRSSSYGVTQAGYAVEHAHVW